MGTGRRRRARLGWWALGVAAAAVAVGAVAGTSPESPAGSADTPPRLASSEPAAVGTIAGSGSRGSDPHPVRHTADDDEANTAEVPTSLPPGSAEPPSTRAVSGPTDDSTTDEPIADNPTAANSTTDNPTAADKQTVDNPKVDAALAALEQIPVKGRAPRTGYDRALFGTAWTDDVTVEFGHNGCDTRNDVLRRDLTDVVLKSDSHGCAVLSGTLLDPYTGLEIPFVRGSTDAGAIQIDHVVALSDAWQKGAQAWDPLQRRNFANDPANLQATDGTTNQRKGAGDAATWLPPNRGYWCTYVARQTEVKATYRLWMTEAEKRRITEILTDCREHPTAGDATRRDRSVTGASAIPNTAASSSAAATDQPAGSTPPDPAGTPAGNPVAPTNGTETPDYRNCTDVWERHGGPILRGDPGYRSKFDGDDDGIGCEKPPR